jgi:hypothetical protein
MRAKRFTGANEGAELPDRAFGDTSEGGGARTGGLPARWLANEAEWQRIRSQGLRNQSALLLARAARAESAALATCAVAERLLGGGSPEVEAAPADINDCDHDVGSRDVSDVEEPGFAFGDGSGDESGDADRLAMADQHPDFHFGLVSVVELFQIWVGDHGLSVFDAVEELVIVIGLWFGGYPLGRRPSRQPMRSR